MRKILLIAAALVLATAACSDDDSGGDDGASGGAPVELEGTVNDDGGTGEVSDGEVEMEQLDNFYFGPTYTKAAAGETVTISLFNEGDTAHTFTIDSLGVDEELEPDATAEIEVTLPESGAIRYYCSFHADQGMQGAFYANDGDTVED